MIIKRKLFTKYDDTDSLKRMKDSDILAAKEKQAPGYLNIIGAGATGATVGAVGGSLGNSLFRRKGTFGNRFVKGGKTGALLGGLVSAGIAARNRNKIAEENQFYNDRLRQAQRWAARREKIDWRQNITGREGYSY